MTTDDDFRKDYPETAKALDELQEWVTLTKFDKKAKKKKGKICTQDPIFSVQLQEKKKSEK